MHISNLNVVKIDCSARQNYWIVVFGPLPRSHDVGNIAKQQTIWLGGVSDSIRSPVVFLVSASISEYLRTELKALGKLTLLEAIFRHCGHRAVRMQLYVLLA